MKLRIANLSVFILNLSVFSSASAECRNLLRTHGLIKSQLLEYCTSTDWHPIYGKSRTGTMKKSLSDWSFHQPNLLSTFPIDPIRENYVRRVPKSVFSSVNPEPLKTDLRLFVASDNVLQEILDLDPAVKNDPLFTKFIAGNELLPGSSPLAHRYGGYQFGYWADQLGDGRAITLGEYVNSKGERWELQLKGAGRTPYSRNGDGRAVLRSSIREFLASEAMFGLGIPTTRAAALVVSKDMVIRDQFYNGRMKPEPAAVVLRIAPTWFRIGSLEILQRENELVNLKQVVDFVLEHHFRDIEPNNYLELFRRIVAESASLVAKWAAVGFVHGVLNTDNMSLLSITIDYGPYGFLDSYDPHFVPNHSDDEGRYSYENQSKIFKWNLACLARALAPLVPEVERSQLADILTSYDTTYQRHWDENFRRKLGLPVATSQEARLIQLLLDMMELRRADFTQTFRQLSRLELDEGGETNFESLWALKIIKDHPNFDEFVALYRKMMAEAGIDEETRRLLMNRTNPQYVLRNWMAEEAIQAAQREGSEDFSVTQVLLKILSHPYTVDPEAETLGYSGPPPSWSRTLRVSCSS